MLKRRYYIEYLHKVDVEPIFDVLRWSYFYASKIKEWRLNNNSLSMFIDTEPQGKPINVEIKALADDVILIRAGIEKLPKFETYPILVKETLSNVKIELYEKDNELIYETKKLKCVLGKDSWYFKILDNKGHILVEEYVEGLYRRAFPVFPLCYKVCGNEIHFIESIKLAPDEAIFGLGERFGGLNKRGQRLLLWNSDTTMTSSDRSYKNIPFYMSTRGYGLFVKNTSKIVFEVGSEYCYNAISFEVWEPYLEYIVFYGPSFKRILQLYTELTGRPSLPPLWSFGLWMSRCSYRNRKEVEEIAKKIRELKIPCDVIHIDPCWLNIGHYCDFEWNTKDFPNPEEMLAYLKKLGFKVSLWEQPYVPKGTKMYEEGVRRGYFVRRKDGSIYHIIDFTNKEVAIVDFTNPKAREWYKNIHKRLFKMGVSVFKCDMGEAVPEDAIFYNGKTGRVMHNLYPLYYQGTVYEAAKEYFGVGLVWGRSGCAGIQRYPVQWSGDSHTTFEDMACILRAGLSYSLSGVAFWSHDIGGFQGPKPSPKLYIRWAQWGLLCSHSRCHGTTPREPWEYGDDALKIFKKFAEIRYSLLPYLYSFAYEACKEGIPLVRPLILEFQEDPTVREVDLEYMLGPYLLIIPVLSETDEVEYYLPEGLWLDWWSHKVISGGTWKKEKVSLDRIPIYIRENSIIPKTDVIMYIGEKEFKNIYLDVFLKDRARMHYFFDNEEFDIDVSREEEAINIELGPSSKKWQIRVFNEDKPRMIYSEQVKEIKWSYNEFKRIITLNVGTLGKRASVTILF